MRIAYAELGAGPDVVCLPPFPLSHLDEMWRLPGVAHWYEHFARFAHVVLYDARGSGLSDREGSAAADCSLEAMSRDLEAVIAAAQLRAPSLVGFFNSTPVVLDFAIHHHETPAVVLWGGWFLRRSLNGKICNRMAPGALTMDSKRALNSLSEWL